MASEDKIQHGIEYHVVETWDLDALIETVNGYTADGWMPIGGITCLLDVFSEIDGRRYTAYMQPMTRLRVKEPVHVQE